MCNWAGRAAAWLGRLTSRMKADLLTGARLFVDETTAKVLAPGTGKVKTGYLWAIARDDGAHGGTDPPAVVRSEEHTSELQSLMRISYAVFCLKTKITQKHKRSISKLLTCRTPLSNTLFQHASGSTQ